MAKAKKTGHITSAGIEAKHEAQKAATKTASGQAARTATSIPSKTFSENRKARFDYEILDTTEAGIELLGTEVKSVRAGRASLIGAYVVIRGNEAFLINSSVPPFQEKNVVAGYDPLRNRRLLLSHKEIDRLTGTSERQGLTLVPLSLYNKGRFIKVSIATVRGKKRFDKRANTRRREDERIMERTLKSGRGDE